MCIFEVKCGFVCIRFLDILLFKDESLIQVTLTYLTKYDPDTPNADFKYLSDP